MKQDKELFHQISSSLEDNLFKIQNAHPINAGAMIRKYMLVNIIVICSLAYLAIKNLEYPMPMTNNFAFAFIALLLCAVAVLTFSSDCETEILPLINKDKERLKDFGDYPDVQYYLQEFDKGLNATIATKKQIVKEARIIFLAMGLCYAAIYIIVTSLLVDYKMSQWYNARYNGVCYDYLDINATEPFFSLLPLTTNIADSVTIDNKKVDFYFVESADKTVLRMERLNLTNNSSRRNFRLTITDENGRTVNHSPVFYFSGGYSFRIESNNLAQDNDNTFDIIHTMRFLKKNQGHLRFVIEKDN